MSSRTAPTGTVTAARLFLLGEVSRGRVVWWTGPGEAKWLPARGDDRRLVDVTDKFLELVRAGWAYVDPAEDEPTPVAADCLPTPAGEDLLIGSRKR